MKLKAFVEIDIDIDAENFEKASEYLHDMLFDSLCLNNDCEIWMDSVEEVS